VKGLIVCLAFVAVAACSAPGAGLSPPPATPTPVPPPGVFTHDDMQLAVNAVQGDPQNFGGLWWDVSGWPLHIAVVSTDPAIRAKVEQWIPAGAPVAWHQVKHSYAALSAIQNEFVSWWNSNPDGHGELDVNGTGIDVVRNIVTFSLVKHVPSFEDDLKSRYGDAVEFVIEPKAEPL
jgi:hypothetical protein